MVLIKPEMVLPDMDSVPPDARSDLACPVDLISHDAGLSGCGEEKASAREGDGAGCAPCDEDIHFAGPGAAMGFCAELAGLQDG